MVDSKRLYLAIFVEKVKVVQKNWWVALLILVFVFMAIDTVWYKSEKRHGTVIELANNETLTGTKRVALVNLNGGYIARVELPKDIVLPVGSKVSITLKESRISKRINCEFAEFVSQAASD